MARGHRGGCFVGRRRELGRLRRLLQWPEGEQVARFVQVVGEPGIGKTRLLQEFAGAAGRAGVPVLWGRADEFERELPFGVFIDAVADHLPEAAVERITQLGEDAWGLLRTVFPLGRGPGPKQPAVELLDIERYRLHRAVRALWETVAAPEGLVLVLDDLHWADAGSIELLDHLIRHPPRARVVVATAFRPRQAPARLSAILSQAELIEVGPLAAAEIEQFLGPGAAAGRRRELYDVGCGNPLYLQALARDGRWTHDADRVCPAGDASDLLRASLSDDFAALGSAELGVAQAAAIAGEEFDADLVAAVADCDRNEVLAVIDRLVDRDLLRPAGVPGHFRYRHPLVRTMAYQTAGAGWRVAAHARAAAALRQRGAPATARAHHVERSAAYGDPAAIDVLLDAAVTTMHTTPATAAHWLEVTLRLLPDDATAQPMRLSLLGMRARALGVTGRLADSRELLHEALRLLPAESAEERARVAGFCAVIDRLLGHHAEARALLLHELDGLADPDSVAAALLKLELAAGRLTRGDFTTHHPWAYEALAIARHHSDRALLATAMGMCVLNGLLDGTVDSQTFASLDETSAVVDALPDGDLSRHLEATVWLGWSEMFLERPAEALRHLDRGLRLARTTGQNHLMTYLRMGQGTTYGLLGRLQEAADCFADALEVSRLTGSDELRAMALANLCWITTWQGDHARALRLGEQAVAAAGEDKDWYAAVAHGLLAQARLHADDPGTCIEILVRAGGGPGLPNLDPLSRAGWYELLAAADARLHHAERAGDWAHRAETLAATLGLHMRTGFARLARAHALRSADPAHAARHAVAAAESFAEAGDRVDAGRAHLLAGVLLDRCGHSGPAGRELASAHALFTACGARGFQARAVRAQRRVNARGPRHSSRSGRIGSLTRRELEIARLVGTGMTNRQIAAQLCVSSKTVEVHVSRILAKLAVPARAAVANALAGAENGGDGGSTGR
ncbi:helix-turn-helix transcriptional regulator [Kutzneria kofuensis]|nr:LuxR family transcriptional regulator [Kutzneria kofuensis]